MWSLLRVIIYNATNPLVKSVQHFFSYFSTNTDVVGTQKNSLNQTVLVSFVVVVVALRPKLTAMVIAGRSVHLTTLFPGQA